jgi:PTH1 family peptidyl-tRNA hydrolase
MLIIVGLGNPGIEYENTFHNLGFMAIDAIAEKTGKKIKKAICGSLATSFAYGGDTVVLAKPLTYMNLSGGAVKSLVAKFKATKNDVLVIYDDFDLNKFALRARASGSAGSHNGMKSIIYQIGTEEFIRVRIGIDPKPPGWDLADYVLSKFKKDEFDAMVQGVTKACDAVEAILRDNVDNAMNKFNIRKENDCKGI